MGHKNSAKDLDKQTKDELSKLTAYGQSKAEVKRSAEADWQARYGAYTKAERDALGMPRKVDAVNDALRPFIFSRSTYDNYEKHLGYFTDYCKEEHNCKTLEECRQYADEWIDKRINEGLSAYTLKLEVAAVGKLYQEPTTNFIPTPSRDRVDIVRSRDEVMRDYGFSLSNNKELIDFCKGTGLRRSELERLKPEQLWKDDKGDYRLHVIGKGGRERDSLIVGPHKDEIVRKIENTSPNTKVWERVPSHADIHGYRADYATYVYRTYERDVDRLPREETYHCKNDRRGEVFDRQAMLIASQNLGHNRIDVIAGHYLR